MGVGEFPGNSQGLGAPAPAISSAVIKAGAAHPPHPPFAIGPASDFNHGRGFLWRAARAASCLFRLLNSSQTRRCHPSWERGSDTAWRPPGHGLPSPPPASRFPDPQGRLAARRSPLLHLTARHRRGPTCLHPPDPSAPPAVGLPACPFPSSGVLSTVLGSPWSSQSHGVCHLCPHHIPPAPGPRC